MKKVLLYFLILISLCFILPIIFTKKFNAVETMATYMENELQENNIQDNEIEEVKIADYDYSKYKTVKLLHTNTNEVEEIKLDEYLVNVVSAEMPVDFDIEALKAQAIVARTYTIYKILNNNSKHEGADICDSSSCCQAWVSKEDRFKRWDENLAQENWNKISSAVNDTIGKIITYEGAPINAFFHSNSGGVTEVPFNVWGGSGYPYLQVVETSGEDAYSQYSSEVTLTKQELIDKLKESYSDIEIDFNVENCIEILELTESGRVKTVKFGNKNLSGVEARTLLGLRSTNFDITIDGDNIKFSVIGYGHGVGMSQTGADALAKQGLNYVDIIKHFYIGIEITNM